MSHEHEHHVSPAIITRLRRAEGHLRHVILMLEEGQPGLDVAQQLLAVEKGIASAKRAMIHEHIDHCLGTANDGAGPHALDEIKAMAKLL